MPRLRTVIAGAAVLIASALVGLVASAALFGGDGGAPAQNVPGRLSALPDAPKGGTDFSPEALQTVPKGSSVVATARRPVIRVHRRAGGGASRRLKQRRTAEGRRLPLVFLVKRRRAGWVQAYLPTRPNLSTGWLKASDVTLAVTSFRVKIQLDSHRMTLLKAGKPMLRAKIAKGRAISPTPTGRYYVTDLLRPPDPDGFYGPYALGLSAHSPVYTSFAGGDGQVGVHGTNRPSALGRDVSSGCIRVSNRVITRLAKLLPVGTPIDISRS